MNLNTVNDGAPIGAFDRCRSSPGKGQVIARDRLGSRPRMLGDRGGNLPGILWGSAMLCAEVPRHLGAVAPDPLGRVGQSRSLAGMARPR
jgi:hypothetical protein